jgi:hypothetical protein
MGFLSTINDTRVYQRVLNDKKGYQRVLNLINGIGSKKEVKRKRTFFQVMTIFTKISPILSVFGKN